MNIIRTGIYKHYKGNLYEVIDTAIHTETQEVMVLYKALHDIQGFERGTLWVRPLTMFCEDIEIDGVVKPRFMYQGSKVL